MELIWIALIILILVICVLLFIAMRRKGPKPGQPIKLKIAKKLTPMPPDIYLSKARGLWQRFPNVEMMGGDVYNVNDFKDRPQTSAEILNIMDDPKVVAFLSDGRAKKSINLNAVRYRPGVDLFIRMDILYKDQLRPDVKLPARAYKPPPQPKRG